MLALVPRHRREFKRPGLYLLLAGFAICLVPPLVWNYKHAWITLSHLRSRGGLDQSFGIRPLEVLGFLGAHFLTFSPLLFLALAWAVVANWRRARQQFKILYLFWFRSSGFRVLLFSFLQRPGRAELTLAFISLSVLAAACWTERLESSRAPGVFLGRFLGLP